MLVIPEGFARLTITREGDAGRAWLTRLPALAGDLLRRWACVPDGPVTHGQVGTVVPVRRGDGTPAVLKVSFPHPGNVHEPDAFAVWDGRGAVRLLERDDERFAMLLERAGTGALAELPDADEAMAVAGRLARRLAVPAPPGLPRLRDRAQEWEEGLGKDAERLGHPLPSAVLDAALATARELAPVQPDTLVHGDLHAANVLRGDREPWLAIDPKGFAGDPAYDAFTLLRSRAADLLTAPDLGTALLRRLAVFAEAAELDRERTVRWAQLRCVQAALWGRDHGDPEWLVGMYDHVAGLLTMSIS
ncbi:phosphotransferase [Streptomyces mobaraensis NBRC 13819 = DSM 40847]|uniref:Aminoglycoside/hydroxyurea antibiotic resistance kinase n=1 Tax=Streptomyces mobaraensis (strain ATCC 29032 / DSM 40847 / JCM 4168 / NBRC 13819 / NCIMB 11159 / IPCR 16-22) TaxID=1223523 RepID=M3C7W3_STRM1|nr:aminoglycoside phosphotransferase family protein [Streptomyces mobaraensis]EMF00027.1 aminoglycoside/hydroxyurea antibiotic resistance kinase [Streptomyces mobaraensis NBRC 13819 = DSM 40847]QTT75327.1 phosphotransferase [Streptomyces mobaraensis NBRC 13819 = DSM 40847]